VEIVQDIDRPDVGGVAPKMDALALKARSLLSAAYLVITASDNLVSSVHIRGAFNTKDKWTNGIFQNGLYFQMFIWPEKGKRYFSPDDTRVTVELSNCSHELKNPKFRKYTGKIDRAIEKIAVWMKSNEVEE